MHSQKSEALFGLVDMTSREKNMKVNGAKTQMICINASKDDVRSYMNVDGKRIVSGDQLKILGFIFGRRPDVSTHVNYLLGKLRRRLWVIDNLKFAGMKPDSLLRVYFSLIRSVADFACVVYHSMLSQKQADALEKIQRRALKTIFG